MIGMGTFGSDSFTADQVAEAVAGGIRAGYRMLDCAACYGNEKEIDAVLDLLRIPPAACESEFHPCFQQKELLEYLNQKGIVSVAYMPIGSPRRPERDIVPEDVDDMAQPDIVEIARKHGVNPAIIALKWALGRGTIPIPFSLHHYEDNLEATVTEPLTQEEMDQIATLECGNRLVKGQVFLWEGANDWHDLWDEYY